MKKQVLKLAALIAAAAITLSACPGAGDEINTGGTGGDGTTTKGVYVLFKSAGSSPSQKIDLIMSSVTIPVFSAGISNEAAFVTRLNADETINPARTVYTVSEAELPNVYPYESDPLSVGPNNAAESAWYTMASKKKYTLQNLPLATARSGYEFTDWLITKVDNTVSSFFTITPPNNIFNLAKLDPANKKLDAGILLDNAIGVSNGTLELTAGWRMGAALAAAVQELEAEVQAILALAGQGDDSSLEFTDEYYIGAKATEGEALEVSNAMEAAERAKNGSIRQMTVEVSGEFCEETDGGNHYYTDQSGTRLTFNDVTGKYYGGGQEYDPSVLPLPKVETFDYIEYDKAAIDAVTAELRRLKNLGVSFSNFVASELSIPVDGAAHSVTVMKNGIYEIELVGASGGACWGTESNNPALLPGTGGKTAMGGYGGHVKGKVTLTKGDVLQFRVGKAGTGAATYNPENATFTKNTSSFLTQQAGGWPNGGIGEAGRDVYPAGGSGGGSSDVFYNGRSIQDGESRGATKNGSTWVIALANIDARFMVAAGGGGGGQAQGIKWGIPATESRFTNDVNQPASNYYLFPSLRGGSAGESGLHPGNRYAGNVIPTYDNGTKTKLFSMNDVTVTPNVMRYWGVYWSNSYLAQDVLYQRGVAGSTSNDHGANGKDMPHRGITEGTAGGGGGWRGGGAWDQVGSNNSTSPSDSYWPSTQDILPSTGSGGGGSNYINGGASGKNFVNTGSSSNITVTDTTYPSGYNGNDKDTYVTNFYGNGQAKIKFIQ